MSNTQISAKIIADSKNPQGNRLTTMVVTFPRFILAELNTHRLFSRNSASSRAIPFEKMVKSVQENPFIPIAWQKDHKGMQGNEYFSNPKEIAEKEMYWLTAKSSAVNMAEKLNNHNTTKQLCNRLLEPFMWHTVILSFTEIENFFELRCSQYQFHEDEPTFKSKKDYLKYYNDRGDKGFSKDFNNYTLLDWLEINKGQSEIHMMALAECMYDAYQESVPEDLEAGEWHIPFGDNINSNDLTSLMIEAWGKNQPCEAEVVLSSKIKIATARAARISYTVVGEEDKPIYLSDFVPGFEYEMKETFGDGVVKNQEDYQNACWIKKIHTIDEFPYIERMFLGKNNTNGFLGLRHIYKKPNYENDIKLHDRLLESGHFSPFEHCARAMTHSEYNDFIKGVGYNDFGGTFSSNQIFNEDEKGWCNNFKGFIQYRYLLENK